MPLVNEVVAPLGAKDLFNSSHPGDDAQFLGARHRSRDRQAAQPALRRCAGDGAGIGSRRTWCTVFLTGVPGSTSRPNVKPSEMLRLNVAIPPSETENPLGVIGGDNAGFPNGRRLGDEVVDVELRVAARFPPR